MAARGTDVCARGTRFARSPGGPHVRAKLPRPYCMSIRARLRQIHQTDRDRAPRRGASVCGAGLVAPGPATIADWREFTSATVDERTVQGVLAETLRKADRADRTRACPDREGEATSPASPSRADGLWPPERVGAWRARLEEQPRSAAVAPTAPTSGAVDANHLLGLIRDRFEEISTLSVEPGRLVVESDEPWRLIRAGYVPATRLFHWQPAAAAAVEALEATLGAVALALRSVTLTPLPSSDFWGRPVVPFEQTGAPEADAADGGPPRSPTVDELARFALASDLLWALGLVLHAVDANAERSTAGRRAMRIARLLAVRTASHGARQEPSLHDEVRLCRVPAGDPGDSGAAALDLPTPLRATDLSRFPTGRLTRVARQGVPNDNLDRKPEASPNRYDRTETVCELILLPTRAAAPFSLALTARSSVWAGSVGPNPPGGEYVASVDPVVLTDHGVPRSAQGYASDEDHAVFAAIHGCLSFSVAADGSIEHGHRWPGPVVGELPWGPDGGAIAWTNGTASFPALTPPYLFWRTSADSGVERIDLPFRPGLGFVAPDLQAFWACLPGGIGRWSPKGDLELLAPELALWSVRPEGASLRLDPLDRDPDGHVRRRRRHHAWLRDADGTMRDVPLDRVGAASSVAPSARWTATVHPVADAVRLQTADRSAVFELSCSFPLCAAWAGGSLVVATLEGELLFFEDLAGRLDELATSAPREAPTVTVRTGGGEP
jgi:hypothetical protein